MNQPLARLAFYLLEPASDDGVVAWNFLDDQLKDATTGIVSDPEEQVMLRHTLATLAYRAGKVLRDAPNGFGDFRPRPGAAAPPRSWLTWAT